MIPLMSTQLMSTRTRYRIASVAVGVLLMTLVGPAVWAAMVPLTLGQLTSKSERIVVGTVQSISDGYRVEWPGVGRMVCSDVTIRVEQDWKAEGPRNLVLQIPGGELPDRGLRVECAEGPKFRKGEKVLVFTAHYMGRETVYSWLQGKYTIFGKRVIGHRGFGISEVVELGILERRIRRLLKKED